MPTQKRRRAIPPLDEYTVAVTANGYRYLSDVKRLYAN